MHKPWTPAELASVRAGLWLDDASAVTLTAGRVTALKDRSANALTLMPSAAGTGPSTDLLAGRRVLSFNGVSDCLVASGGPLPGLFQAQPAGFALLVVDWTRRANTSQILVYHPNGAQGQSRFNVNITAADQSRIVFSTRRNDGDATTSASSGVLPSRYVIAVIVMDWSTATIRFFIDGALSSTQSLLTPGLTSNTPAIASGRMSIGADADMNVLNGNASAARLGCAIIGNQLISDADRERLEGWAAHRYGLAANLPEDHPYAAAAPITEITFVGQLRAPHVGFGGAGVIRGQVLQSVNTVESPLRRRVMLVHVRSNRPVAQTWSDANTGAYEFTGLDMREQFAALAYDYNDQYAAVIGDHLVPQPQ